MLAQNASGYASRRRLATDPTGARKPTATARSSARVAQVSADAAKDLAPGDAVATTRKLDLDARLAVVPETGHRKFTRINNLLEPLFCRRALRNGVTPTEHGHAALRPGAARE